MRKISEKQMPLMPSKFSNNKRGAERYSSSFVHDHGGNDSY